MVFLVALGLAFVLQLFTVSWYALRESVAGRRAALPFKALCGLLTLAALGFCAAIAPSFAFAWFPILAADLLLCFAASLVRNADRGWSLPLSGGLWLAALLAESLLFSRGASGRFGVPLFTGAEIAVWVVLTAAFVALTFDSRLLHPGKYRFALIFLAAAEFLALVKAVRFGILCQRAGGALQSLSFAVILSAVGFFIAAAAETAALFGSGETARGRLLKSYCYFFGRMLLACGVLFAGG